MPLAELRRTNLAGTQPLRRTIASLGARLRFGEREPWIVLAPLVVAQWIVVGAFALFFVERNGWLFYQGGDQTWFYTSAWMLAGGEIPETFVGYTLPFLYAPIAWIAGANILAGLPAVLLFQFFVLLPLGLLLIYAIAARIGGRLLGYWAAALWIAVPFLTIPLFVDRYHETYVELTLPQVFGLTGLGDFPSMIAVLVAAYFGFRTLETRATPDAVATGLAAGVAIGIKPANGLFVFAPLVALVFARQPRNALVFAAALLPSLVALTAWKMRGSGISFLVQDTIRLAAEAPPAFEPPDYQPPTTLDRLREYVPFDIDQLNYQFLGFREFFFSARVIEFVPIAGALAVARRSVPQAAFLATWLAAFFLVKGSSEAVNVETGSIWRLLMPAFPAYFLLLAAIPLLVPVWGERLAGRFPVRSRALRLRSVAFVAAVVVFLAIPLAALAVLPPSRGDRAAKLPHQSLFVPHDADFEPRIEAVGDQLRLSWTPPRRASADQFYVVLSAPQRSWFPQAGGYVVDGIHCREGGASRKCTVEMGEVGRTRDNELVFPQPRGLWTYRVALAANWRDDPGAGDILLISKPLNVQVR
jgi:hypothetical protein